MAVNLQEPSELLPVAGVRLAAVPAGIRYQGRDDLLVMALAEGSEVAAVFTRNAFCAAPVTLARQHLAQIAPRYLLINAGNANAGTGEAGLQAARESCALLAEQAGCQVEAVLPFSTGVIGQALPVKPFAQALPQAVQQLQEDQWLAAAKAIMTTDTVPKAKSCQVTLSGGTVTLTGIAKGSGMIHPNMATMLAYVATDAQIEQAALQALLQEVADETFNCITVDGDTSTNDALVLAATGASGIAITSLQDMAAFRAALQELCLYLAQAIVRDGEGATKFVSICVEEASSPLEARQVAQTVALSPLVKTALFASDPNWGRILAAVGRSPIADLDVGKVTIYLGQTLLIDHGEPAVSYTEEQGAAEMQQDELAIYIHLDRGEAASTVWTCDLSYDYVKINAEYRS